LHQTLSLIADAALALFASCFFHNSWWAEEFIHFPGTLKVAPAFLAALLHATHRALHLSESRFKSGQSAQVGRLHSTGGA